MTNWQNKIYGDMGHIYKDIETSDLLNLIPIEDAIAFYGLEKIIFNAGQDEVLTHIDEDKVIEHAETIKRKYND